MSLQFSGMYFQDKGLLCKDVSEVTIEVTTSTGDWREPLASGNSSCQVAGPGQNNQTLLLVLHTHI